MRNAEQLFPDLVTAIESMQWLQSTNSLLYSGTEKGITELTNLLAKLDVDLHDASEAQKSAMLAMADEFSSLPSSGELLLSSYTGLTKPLFQTYKLQYHSGKEIAPAIQQLGSGLKHSEQLSSDLVEAISSLQWVQPTNSFLYSGTEKGTEELTALIKTLDIPKKQVFIEVLVIETNLQNSLEFGLEWGSSGQYREKFSYGLGNFNPNNSAFSRSLQKAPLQKKAGRLRYSLRQRI